MCSVEKSKVEKPVGPHTRGEPRPVVTVLKVPASSCFQTPPPDGSGTQIQLQGGDAGQHPSQGGE